MNTLLTGAFSASLIAGSIALTSCGEKATTESEASAEKKVLIITAIPDKKVSDQSIKYQPLVNYLKEKLDVEVKFVNSTDYNAAKTKFTNDEAQLVWFGGLSGVQARQKVEGARAIAQGVVDPEYKSYFIAHESTGLQPTETFPKEIADYTFTFGSKSSTSGRLMPTWFIEKESGKKVDAFFSKPVQFQGKLSHAGTAKAVNSGSVQVGVLSYKTYEKMVKKGEIDPTKAVKIWETPGYSDYNFTAHPSLDEKFGEGFVDKLQAALVECKDEKVLNALAREEGLIKAKNADFDGIVKVAKELGFVK